VAIDEFSALGADNVLALLARGREAGVGVILATQELADLDRAARGLRDQVLGNTAVKIAHRQDVPESADTVARLAGSVERWERTYQERPGRLPGTRVRGGTSARLTTGYAIEPETIRSLPTGRAVVITKVPQASSRLTRVAPPARSAAQPPVPGVTR
jgi:conjugal transfer pilus assembly protein TraD